MCKVPCMPDHKALRIVVVEWETRELIASKLLAPVAVAAAAWERSTKSIYARINRGTLQAYSVWGVLCVSLREARPVDNQGTPQARD